MRDLDHCDSEDASWAVFRAGITRVLRRCLRGAGLAVFAWAASGLPAAAASLQVSPISLEIRPQEQGQTLYLSNSGDTVLRAQVRVQQWSQSGGEDRLTPTREVVASPPLVEIAPGARQMVRIVKLQAAPSVVEKTYRLIVDELPPESAAVAPMPASPASGASSNPAGTPVAGLKFLLRYSIPVFVLPAPTPAQTSVAQAENPDAIAAPVPVTLTDLSALSARVQGGGQPNPVLHIENTGVRRVKLSQLVYVSPSGQRTVLVGGLLGYVLAGQRMQWPLAIPAQALQGGGSLRLKFNDDQTEQVLPLAPDRS